MEILQENKAVKLTYEAYRPVYGAINFSQHDKLTCWLEIHSYSNGIQVVRNKGIRKSIPSRWNILC